MFFILVSQPHIVYIFHHSGRNAAVVAMEVSHVQPNAQTFPGDFGWPGWKGCCQRRDQPADPCIDVQKSKGDGLGGLGR